MKTFIFKAEYQKGYNNRICRVYRIKRNNPIYLGSHSFCTASCRGNRSEVFNALIEWGYIPKGLFTASVSSWSGAGYYCPKVEEKGYKIIEI